MRSFSLVDQKVAETELFLKQLADVKYDFFAARCYASAFTTAARSMTFALQAVMRQVAGFDEWYMPFQDQMKADPKARFFQSLRNVSYRIGENLVSGGSWGPGQVPRFWFRPTRDIPEVPQEDVLTCCREYFTLLVGIIYECYLDFGPEINAHQYYTAENFRKHGRSIDDADEEVFGIRGWTDVSGFQEEFRWQAIRDQMIGCEINCVFQEYLGKEVPRPSRLQ